MLRVETMKRSGLWSSLDAHGSLVILWCLCISGSGETRHSYFILSLIWPWRSRSIALQNYRDLNQWILHLWSKFGDLSLNGWWVMVRTSSQWGKVGIWPNIWPWRSRSIAPQNNRDINQVILHLLAKFGDLSLNASRVIVRTNRWLTETHTHTDAGNDNTRRPKLASGKNARWWEGQLCSDGGNGGGGGADDCVCV